MFQAIKNLFRKRRLEKRVRMIRQAFETGKPISRFIARDVRREILVVNIDELSSGFIIARTRTSNLFYLSKKLTEMREFGKPERISIEDIWNWTGQSWGGLPDGTSIVENRERVEERAIQ